jgi:hypothetical protein
VTEQSNSPFTRKWLLVCFGLEIIGMAMFGYFGIFQYFFPVLVSVGAILLAACFTWKLHYELWFWFTLIVAVLIHAPLVYLFAKNVPHMGHIDGHGVAGLVLVDAVLISAVIRFPDWLEDTIKWFSSDNTEYSNGKNEFSKTETESEAGK